MIGVSPPLRMVAGLPLKVVTRGSAKIFDKPSTRSNCRKPKTLLLLLRTPNAKFCGPVGVSEVVTFMGANGVSTLDKPPAPPVKLERNQLVPVTFQLKDMLRASERLTTATTTSSCT